MNLRQAWRPVLLGWLVLATGSAAAELSREERLWHHRNLGKAFYENPATQYEAVGELEKALALAPDSVRERVNYGLALFKSGKVDEGIAQLERAQKQDPNIPHTWFNLGIAYKQQSRYPEAIRQLEGMVARVATEPITHYNLGVLYKLEGQTEKALVHFERSAALDPNLAGPHFQLATAYRQAGRAEDAQKAMTRFREIKALQTDAAFPEDLEWSWYSELYEVLEPAAARRPAPPARPRFEAREAGSPGGGAPGGLALLDADADGKTDLIAWNENGAALWSAGTKLPETGLETLRELLALVPGDLDNDGFADLVVVSRGGAFLLANRAGRFVRSATSLPAGNFRGAVWLDYDHDYDLDLVLLGDRSLLLRNQGAAGFADQTASFPFVPGRALAGARFDLVADTQAMDLVVTYEDRPAVLYRDRLNGRYEARPLPVLPAGAAHLQPFDLDQDGWTDLLAATPGEVLWLRNDQREGLLRGKTPALPGTAFALADLDNRGVNDLATPAGLQRAQAPGQLGAAQAVPELAGAVHLTAGDFDADGRLDLAALKADGRLRLLLNRIEAGHNFLELRLAGVKNLKLAPGSEVEVKAGPRYQKKIYEGWPLLFGLGRDEQVDTVRITWPNGLIQNEARQSAGRREPIAEAQRLSGSCPMIFTWNGSEFEFITDVLGVAPLGATAGDGTYFPVDHDEVIQIPGSSLVPREGRYEIRVTEELREVAYLDEIRLIAVDHPQDLELFTNDKFKGPPFPEFRLYGVGARHHAASARDHHGRDVTAKLAARDRVYPDSFERDYAGVAEHHFLELDFGPVVPSGDAVLVLSGWVDWADGSTFLAASQEDPRGLLMPSLQVEDEAGEWRTVIEDMGIPAGKPKTIVVDLAGKFLSASRKVRIVTNLCVYWDEIFLAPEAASPPFTLAELHAADAALAFRGFSRVEIHPERKQPERFVYADLRPLSMWNPTPGHYTRYGDVRPLLGATDDRFVIMGSGDELRLSFEAAGLPPVPRGWARDFLLFVDGWAKDGDANTAHSQTVEPYPFHGMQHYPYEAPERYPDKGPLRVYQEHYNTRPALRLIRPLVEGLGGDLRVEGDSQARSDQTVAPSTTER